MKVIITALSTKAEKQLSSRIDSPQKVSKEFAQSLFERLDTAVDKGDREVTAWLTEYPLASRVTNGAPSHFTFPLDSFATAFELMQTPALMKFNAARPFLIRKDGVMLGLQFDNS